MNEAAEQGLDARTDTELISAVRRGDTTAYGSLYERHLAAAKRAATYLASTTSEREDLVAEAFTRVLQVLRTGRGPSTDFRPYLLVTMRHAAINAARRNPATALYGELPEALLRAVTDDLVSARIHGDDAAIAFTGLPERWRVVLWHTEVVGASPAAIAPLLGMTPNGVAALAYRAREGLRQAYLRQQLPPVHTGDCRMATEKLAAWVRRSVSAPQRRKISAHLDRCERCRELAAGLQEVNAELRADVAPAAVSWLSVVKGAFAAASVKFGTAAAIAAVAAVTVASQPAPPGGHPGAMPGLTPMFPDRTHTQSELPIRPLQPDGTDPAPAEPATTTAPDESGKADESTPESSESGSESGSGSSSGSGEPATPATPTKPERPIPTGGKPDNVGQPSQGQNQGQGQGSESSQEQGGNARLPGEGDEDAE